MEAIHIPLTNIQSNPRQPRSEFDAGEMASLVESVKQYGILQPLMVTPSHDGIYVLIAGERRLRAAREAGLEEVPAVIVPDATERDQLELALIENIQRADLNPLEKARAYQMLADEFNLSHEDIASKVGVSRSTVTNALRLLKLPEDIHTALLSGALKERQAAALLTLFDLPVGLRDEAEKGAYANHKPSYIVKQAQTGASSDTLRELIDSMVRNNSKDLNRAIWSLDYTFLQSETIYWPDCRSCELRHKSLNVCTNPACYEAKEQAWVADYLQQASAVSGILPLESDIPSYQITHLEYHRSAESILTSGCENLRLEFSPYSNGGSFTLADKDYPKALIVCRKGNAHCKCLQGAEILAAQKRREEIQRIQDTPQEQQESDEIVEPVEAEESQPDPEQEWEQRPQRPTAEELAELVKEEKKRQKENAKLAKSAQEQAVQIFDDALADNVPGAWRLIYNRVALGEPWKDRPDDISEIRKGIAARIVTYRVQYLDPSRVVDELKEMLADAGLPELQL
jgi:ParB/RepB/Spo0J family partition protein